MSKTDVFTITKIDTEMFYRKSWKPFYFGVERSKVNVTSQKNIAGVGVCALVSAGLFGDRLDARERKDVIT